MKKSELTVQDWEILRDSLFEVMSDRKESLEDGTCPSDFVESSTEYVAEMENVLDKIGYYPSLTMEELLTKKSESELNIILYDDGNTEADKEWFEYWVHKDSLLGEMIMKFDN